MLPASWRTGKREQVTGAARKHGTRGPGPGLYGCRLIYTDRFRGGDAGARCIDREETR
jgi:hypothetical protein